MSTKEKKDETKIIRKPNPNNTLKTPFSSFKIDIDDLTNPGVHPDLALTSVKLSKPQSQTHGFETYQVEMLEFELAGAAIREREQMQILQEYVEKNRNLIRQNIVLWISVGVLSVLAGLGIIFLSLNL